MKTMDEKEISNEISKIVYNMIKGNNNLFMPYGMLLNAVDIRIYDNSTFPLKDYTCAFYNPLEKSVNINLEDEFFKGATLAKIVFILLHEITHGFLSHDIRGKEKNKQIFNMAQDYEIHNLLFTYRELINNNVSAYSNLIPIFSEMDKFLFCKDTEFCFKEEFLPLTQEEIYLKLINDKKLNQSMSFDSFDVELTDENGNPTGQTVTVEVSTDKNGNKTVEVKFKDGDGNEKNGGKDDKSKQQNQQNNQIAKSMLGEMIKKEMERQKGNVTSHCKTFLDKMLHTKIDWQSILRNSLFSELEKAGEYTWNKPRTSMYSLGYYLPAEIEDNEKYGVLIISRDESGSMTDTVLRKAQSIITEAKEHFSKVILLKHDTEIVSIEEFEEVNADMLNSALTRSACGGTSHKAVFDYIKKFTETHEEKISAYIGITDLESDIELCQDTIPPYVPIFYLVESNFIDFDRRKGNIRGKLINIED